MRNTGRRGQSILEYTLLLGVVIAAVVAVLFAKGTGVKDKVEDVYNQSKKAIENTSEDMKFGVFEQ